jgi:kumamolisin
VPDVSALAGSPLYELTLLGRSAPNGGTSASAPLWASLIARINAAIPTAKQQRFFAPLLYRKAASGKTVGAAGCTDITSGDNTSHPQPGKGYKAVVGFNAVAGWGVPNGKALMALMAAL